MARDKKDKKTASLPIEKAILTAGAALAAQRKIVKKKCDWCGGQIVGTSRKMYCNNKCKQAKKNAAKKENN